MPDGADNFKGFYPTRKTAEAHERIFGPGMHAHDHDWGQNRTTDDAVPSRGLGQNPPASERIPGSYKGNPGPPESFNPLEVLGDA